MTAQPSPRETSIELVADSPVRPARSKAATQTTTKKTTKSASKSTSKTVAKTATTRQRSATKSVSIAKSSLQATAQTASTVSHDHTVTTTVTADSCLANLQHCQQFFNSAILAESDKLTQSMGELASIALRIQQLQRPSFEPLPVMIPVMTPRVCNKSQATIPAPSIAQPPSKIVFVSTIEPVVEPTLELTLEPTAITTPEPQRPSRTSTSRLTVHKPIPPYNPSGHPAAEATRSPAVAPNYWGGNVQAPAPTPAVMTPAVAKASQMRSDRLDLPVFPDRPVQPVLYRLAQQQPLSLPVQQPRRTADVSIQTHSRTDSLARVTLYQQIQRLVPIPTGPIAIGVDAILWTVSSVGVHVILQVCIQVVPMLSFPLHLVMLFPALFAAYLAFCVPKSSTPPVYRCLLTTLGFFLGSKL